MKACRRGRRRRRPGGENEKRDNKTLETRNENRDWRGIIMNFYLLSKNKNNNNNIYHICMYIYLYYS